MCRNTGIAPCGPPHRSRPRWPGSPRKRTAFGGAIDEQYETRHECDKELLVLETENDELRLELERSEAKVEVLSKVLSRKNA